VKNQNRKTSAEVYPKLGRGLLLAAKVFLVASSAVLLAAAYQPVLAQGLLGEETEIIRLTNQLRQDQGLPALIVNNKLNSSALAKANDMAANNYFGHADKLGNRMAYWIKAAGYNYLRAGENLAKGFSSPESTVAAWVNSPTHYANLLNSNYREIGVGITQGYLDGRLTTFVVQHFGELIPKLDLTPAAVIKPLASFANVLGDNLDGTAPPVSLFTPALEINNLEAKDKGNDWPSQYNEATTINNSPGGLLLVVYDDIRDGLLRQRLMPAALADDYTTLGLPPRGYQIAQIVFTVLAALGIWGWLSALMWPVYAWLIKLKSRT
jgi:uncharacterized protein YkwD